MQMANQESENFFSMEVTGAVTAGGPQGTVTCWVFLSSFCISQTGLGWEGL